MRAHPPKRASETFRAWQAVLSERDSWRDGWAGISGEQHVPVVGEWQQLITESRSFLFFGFEPFLNHILPSSLCDLQTQSLQVFRVRCCYYN